nr:immunoglobulin domain-containing protein oig-4-like isoform X6 [Lepeophtheirus salmonis]
MYLKISNMFFPILQPPTFIYIFVMFLLLVREGARITKASHFDYEYVLGHKIVFICVAKGKPRPKIIWFKDGRELYDHGYLHISEWYKGKRRLKSKMEIDPATQLKFEPIIEKHKKATKMSCDKISSRKNYHRKKWRCWYI